MSAIPLEHDVEYPETDGQPMAESDLHQDEMIYLRYALREHFRGVPDVYVAGNLFLYYKKGDPRSVVAPDLFVVKGVPSHSRQTYLLWNEGGRVPCLIVEITSDSTSREDLGGKKALYERLGVEEYILFDLLGDYLDPQLQGYRLEKGRYQPIEADADGCIVSEATGILFRPEGDRLRLLDVATGEALARPEEEAEARQLETEWRRAAEARANQEAAARKAAEEELARLREEIERLRKERGE